MKITTLAGKIIFFLIYATLLFVTNSNAQDITTIAGGNTGEGKIASSIGISQYPAMATDAAGNLYVLDSRNRIIRRVDGITGVIKTIAKNIRSTESSMVLDDTAHLIYLPESRNLVSVDMISGDIKVVFSDPDFLSSMCRDKKGNFYYSAGHTIQKIAFPSLTRTTIAGTGEQGYSGDGGPAVNATLGSPKSVTCDTSGFLYFADNNNNVIRKINLQTGIINTVAGTGAVGFSGDGGLAINASFSHSYALTANQRGDLFLSDNNRIRKIEATTGIVRTIAGGNFGGFGDGGPAISARFNNARNVHISSTGNIYIEDFNNFRIRMIDSSTNLITTVCGNGSNGVSGIGGPAKDAQLNSPTNLAVDHLGNIFIADRNNYQVYRIDHNTQIISRFAGTGSQGTNGGDGVPATSANIFPESVATDSSGSVYFIDNGRRIRKVDRQTGIITTVAGITVYGYSGDGGPAANASFNNARSIHIDSANNIFIVDAGNHCIRKISATGIITTIAGNGTAGYSGDGNLATTAQLSNPFNVTTDTNGNLYISDNGNRVVRKVDVQTGIISTIAGNGTRILDLSPGPATERALEYPTGMVTDNHNNLFIADRFQSAIKKVELQSGIMTRYCGTGSLSYNGDEIPFDDATLNNPSDIKFDQAGNLYIADMVNNRIRKIIMSSTITGLIFYDVNLNGIMDTGEQPADEIQVDISKPGFAVNLFTDNGKFKLDVDTGSYTIKPVTPLYYTISPAVRTSVLGQQTKSDTAIFALQPQPGISDLRVDHTGYGPARAGFDFKYLLFYKNEGTAIIDSVKLSFVKSHKFRTTASSIVPTSVSGDTLTWILRSVSPKDNGAISISGTIAAPPVTQINDLLQSTVYIDSIAGDPDHRNDTSLAKIVVTGSYDPNDKNELHNGIISPDKISQGEWLYYKIRFQNTGNDTAFTVMIRDTLSTKHIPGSLQIISASHDYSLTVKGGYQLTWIFKNILLPDSTTNTDASNGYIYFRVKAENNLLSGDQIENTAYIYFDYNLPVQTNTVVTKIKEPLPPPVKPVVEIGSSMYCKPNGNQVIKIANMPIGGTTTVRAGIGDSLLTIAADSTVIVPVGDLAAGSYLLWIEYANENSISESLFSFEIADPITPELNLLTNKTQVTNLSETVTVRSVNTNGGGIQPAFTFALDRNFSNIIQQESFKDSVVVSADQLQNGANWIYVKMKTSAECFTSLYDLDSISISKNIIATGIVDPDNPLVVFNTFPNPFTSTITMAGFLPSKKYNVVLTAIGGAKAAEYVVVNKNSLTIPAPLNLQTGYYFLSVYDLNKNLLLGTIKVIHMK